MDAESFFEELRDTVGRVREAARRRELADLVGERRRELADLVREHPEEFAGLVLALAASANESWAGLNERISRLEAKVDGP